MPRKHNYIGGIIGADPLPSGAPRPGVSNLGSLGGDGASSTRPTRRWSGMTGRSLVEPYDEHWDDVTLLLDGSSVTDASVAGNNFINSGATLDATPSPDHPYAVEPVVFDFPTGAGTVNTTQEYLYSSAGAFDGMDNGDPFTIELWAKADALGNSTYYRGLFAIGGPSSSTGLSIRANGTTLAWWVAGTQYLINHQVALNTTGWFHIALVYDGSVSTLFVNGTPSSSTSSGTPNFGTNAVAVIGRVYAGIVGYHWNGQITDVRITKGVARYTGPFDPPTESFPNTASPLAATGVLSLAEHYQSKL